MNSKKQNACCVVYKEDYPWDVRVEKILLALRDNGYPTSLVSRNLDQRPTIERLDSFHVHRLPMLTGWPVTLRRLFQYPLFFNPLWLSATLRATSRSHGGVLIIRDLPLALLGIIVARYRDMSVILDMAECYPEMYRSELEATRPSLFKRLLKNPTLASMYERLTLRFVDHVWVMIEESQDRLIARGVSPDKISIVSNTPPFDDGLLPSKRHTTVSLRLVYVGFVTEIRGLDIAIRAVHAYVNRYGGDVQLDIVGRGSAKRALEDLVKALDLKEIVKVHGWLSHEEVDGLMKSADIGILTYRGCAHWNHTIPNKIFDYMKAGLPIVATDVHPIARIIRNEECGLVCQEEDVTELAQAINHLRDPARRQSMGENGQRAIRKEYNWEREKRKLIQSIKSLTNQH